MWAADTLAFHSNQSTFLALYCFHGRHCIDRVPAEHYWMEPMWWCEFLLPWLDRSVQMLCRQIWLLTSAYFSRFPRQSDGIDRLVLVPSVWWVPLEYFQSCGLATVSILYCQSVYSFLNISGIFHLKWFSHRRQFQRVNFVRAVEYCPFGYFLHDTMNIRSNAFLRWAKIIK